MGFFKKCGTLLKSFFGMSLRNIEEKNPELLFQDISEKLSKVKKEAEEKIIEVQTSVELIKMDNREIEKNLELLKSRIDAAKEKQDRELLTDLLIKEEELTKAYEEGKASYEEAVRQLAEVKEEYRELESELNSRLNELKALKSQAQLSALKENINSLNTRYISGSGALAELNASMERAREIVARRKAQAEAIRALGSDDTDQKLRRLDMESSRKRAEEKAELLLKNMDTEDKDTGC
jgi:phage shock protein A